MSKKLDDDALEAALQTLANDTSAVSPEFASKLADIPQAVAQRRTGILLSIVKAFGGWGFAAPQLAGLAVAAYVGVMSGQANADRLTEDEVELMAAHLFGDSDTAEWLE